MSAKLFDAPDARDIATRLIAAHHQHLQEALMLYVFTDQKRTKNGKRVLGTASKLSAKERFLMRSLLPVADGADDDAQPAFLILLDLEMWRLLLTPEQRDALIDHELCHCVISDGDAAIRGHDVEEFRAVIEWHGLWEPALEELHETMAQLRFAL